MQNNRNLFELPDVDAYFFDMFGVLWSGHDFYENVLDVLKHLRSLGKKVYILSNQTVTAQEFIQKRTTQGLLYGTHYDDVITSGRVCAEAVQAGLFEKITNRADYRFYVLGAPNPSLFESVQTHQTETMEKADVFYIGSIENNDITLYQNEFIPQMKTALARGIPAVCANPDRFVFIQGEKKIVQGAAARWYEKNGGKLILMGKPFESTFEYALQKTGASKEKSVMVGDMLLTDIWGANRFGMRSVLVMQTGISAFDMQKNQIDLSTLIRQTAQEENASESAFEPTFCIPAAGIFPTK